MVLNLRSSSYLISLGIHILILLIFLFITFSPEYPPREFVEVGFGNFGTGNPSGGKSTQLNQVQESTDMVKADKAEEIVKDIELPKAKATEDENAVVQADKSKETTRKESKSERVQDTDKPAANSSNAIGSGNEGPAGFGYEIDFGGKGTRRIYSYSLPRYPDGVSKEIDVKLRFTILPDGTVGTIFPIIKADPRLENAAINSLRQWRFEPLPRGARVQEQTAVIVFPYRLQ